MAVTLIGVVDHFSGIAPCASMRIQTIFKHQLNIMTFGTTGQENSSSITTEEVDNNRRQFVKIGLATSLSTIFGMSPLTAHSSARGDAWVPKRTVIVILENSSFGSLTGMPYLKELADASAMMMNSYAASTPYGIVPTGGPFGVTPGTAFIHPLPARGSQTNYFYQFAGHNQGIFPDWFQSPGSGRMGTAYSDQYGNTLPAAIANTEIGLSNELLTSYLKGENRVFTTPNLGAAIIQVGHTYATFSESLPHPYFEEKSFNPEGIKDGYLDTRRYQRRHNPGINWINFPGIDVSIPSDKQRFLLPVSSNLATAATVDPAGNKYPGFGVDKDGRPASFDTLPTVSIVVPNNMHNLHSGSKSACDDWLKTFIKPYADWARDNDSLLLVTTDEDGFTDSTNGVSTLSWDKVIRQYIPGATGSYMYGMDNVTTLFHGPTNRVVHGQYPTRVDQLNVLSTVLHMYGALATFRADFASRHGATTDAVRSQETKNQLANLTPFTDFLS